MNQNFRADCSIILASHNLSIGIVGKKEESGSSIRLEHIQIKNQTTKKKKLK